MRFSALVMLWSLAVMAQAPDPVTTQQISSPIATEPAGAASTDSVLQASPSAAVDSSIRDTASSTSVASPAAFVPAAVPPVVDTAKPAVVTPRRTALKRLPQVAVLSFTGEGIAAKDLNAVTSRFESELLASDSFKVVERRNVDKILREQGFQMSGACDNSECSVEIGQLLSVDGIYTGELAKVGKTWSLSVKRTDVGSGQTMFSHVLDIQGSLEDVLRGGCPEMALIASGRKKPENNHTVLVAKKGSVWPWVVGGGAVVAGGTVAAVLLLSQDESSSDAPTTSSRTVDITFNTEK